MQHHLSDILRCVAVCHAILIPRYALVYRAVKRKGKERKISQNRYIPRICREAPREPILAKFCASREMVDLITCADFGV